MRSHKLLPSLIIFALLLFSACPKPPGPTPPPVPPEPPEPPPIVWPQAPDYNGRLIGTTAYSLIKYPIEDIEWFLRELVAAGGNATEALLVTTWDDTWEWQPYKRVKWETEKWKNASWNPDPAHKFPVYDLTKWNETVWAKWRQIFSLCQKMNITIIVRVQDFCSRKVNYLERHWAMWSNVQSHRWGGPMHGGYLHWPIGDGGNNNKEFIWPYYDALNIRLVAELNASGVDYYIEPWNELQVTKGSEYDPSAPDELMINLKVHNWFAVSLKAAGCPADRLICNVQRLGMSDAEWKAQANKALALGFTAIELHGCASPQVMRQFANRFGNGRTTSPNGDGTDQNAQGINDGRPFYTEPSLNQAQEMGRIIKNRDLWGYIYKNRSLRNKPSLRKANFSAVRGLAEGIK